MAERVNRDTTYDIGRHIVTSEKVPLSGSDNSRKIDAELDRNDPMEDFTNVMGASGLISGDPQKDSEVLNMAVADNCYDESTKGSDLSYGPKNIGPLPHSGFGASGKGEY